MKPVRLIAVGLMAALGLTAAASPARPGVRVFRQADGSTISLRLAGDEFSHSYITTDGFAVSRQADGNFYYATAEGISPVVAHEADARTESEKIYLSENGTAVTAGAVLKARRTVNHTRKAPARATKRQVPCIGSPSVPVILVQYKDYKFKDSDPNATFTEFFTQGSKSAYQYFYDQSNGKYTPQFDVYGPYTLSDKRSEYGGNTIYGGDKGVGRMVGEGCLGLDEQIDFSRYDNDGDGVCDVVIVLYAGDGESTSYEDDSENAVWPCQWALRSSDYGKFLTLDGTTVDRFAVFNELSGYDVSKIDGIGTFCHEFSHCLDLPDFYDTEYGPHFGMGPWSLMDQGCYNNDGYTPIGYSAYEKAYMGWIDIEEAGENSFYTLPAMNGLSEVSDKAVRITNAADPNEYYILENRKRQGWDAYLPAEGLLITHITYNANAWANNVVNNYDLQRVTPIPADNNLKIYRQGAYYFPDEDDFGGDLWPWQSATELSDNSLPAAKVNTGSYMHKPVTEITREADGSVSFWVMKAALPAVAAPTNLQHQVLSSTSVNISWTPGDESEVTYTVEIKQHHDVQLLMSTDFTNSGHGWTKGGYTEISDQGIRLGSNKQLGSVTSPVFTAGADGQVTVRLNACYYSDDESGLKVSLLDQSGNESDSETIVLTAQDGTYAVLLQGQPESEAKVCISTLTAKKRAYISHVDIYSGDATDISAMALAPASESTARTLTGITGTSCRVDGLLGNGTFDYRVKAVPADSENYSASAWTAKQQFTLGGNSSAAEIAADSATAEYYTLQGLRLNGRPSHPGIYIERRGTQVRKIAIAG